MRLLDRLSVEPPFRIAAKAWIRLFANSVGNQALWDIVDRPHYLTGVLAAAPEAKRQGIAEISVAEFGVAGGNGLLALQQYAAAVEKDTGVRIAVYGFDKGKGLPQLCGDFRDHPDQWREGDYWMEEHLLRSRLAERTTLIVGDVRETVSTFVREAQVAPLGFVAMDLDLYSSTMAALKIFTLPGKRMLLRVPMYFDDVNFSFNHKFAGELRAIDEFNSSQDSVKIDIWRGLRNNRPFPDASWINNMYIAHDIESISKIALVRAPAGLGLEKAANH